MAERRIACFFHSTRFLIGGVYEVHLIIQTHNATIELSRRVAC